MLKYTHAVQHYNNHISTCTLIKSTILFTQPWRSWISLNIRLAGRHGVSISSTRAPWWFNAVLMYEHQLPFPRQFLDFRFAALSAAAVFEVLGIYHLLWLSPPKVACALNWMHMFGKTSLHIGGHTSIQSIVTGPDDVDIPFRHVRAPSGL